MSDENKTMPEIIVPESSLGEFSDRNAIPIGFHKAKISKIHVVTPDDQFNSFGNYQYRLTLEFPQFSEEDKLPPALFHNITVLTQEKDADKNPIPDAWKCCIFPGGTSKAVKVLDAIGVEVVPKLKITPELFIGKEVVVNVSPYTNKKGEKSKIAKEIFALSELGETPAPAPKVKKETKNIDPAIYNDNTYDEVLKDKFQGDKDKFEKAIQTKTDKFNNMIPREGIIVMIKNGDD